ncbi:glycosyltransferase [Rubrivivax rivuli]|uniref:Glycosyltransferase n=1 Tax=Rubrivivax rivuli TaxID=1862385 RepID=A0A437RFU4_9BURK|nr:glycosyltransferase [Rubrivivax rivuli]
MRVLHLIRSLDTVFGGPAEGVRQTLRLAQAEGHAAEVLSLDDEPAGALGLVAMPGTVHTVPGARGGYGYTPVLDEWLRAHAAGYDALVVHGLWQYHGVAARRAARACGRPYFVFSHGMLDPWFRRAHPFKHLKKQLYWLAAEHAVLRDAQAVLFTTEEEARLARQTFVPYAAQGAVVGYGAAPDETARSSCAEDFLGLHPGLRGRRLLLFLGRLHEKKGCDLLVQAFAHVAQRQGALHLVMAGPDSQGLQARLEALARQAGIESRVSFTGMLEGRAKWGALRAAEAFVLPSHQENFGIAVAEALAVGTPVLLSTQVNTWREVVRDGAGLADADTLEGTQRLLERWLHLPPSTRHAMRMRALACFDTHFRIEASVQRLHALIAAAAPDSQPCNTPPRQ